MPCHPFKVTNLALKTIPRIAQIAAWRLKKEADKRDRLHILPFSCAQKYVQFSDVCKSEHFFSIFKKIDIILS